MAPMGRQWFSLQEWTPESILAGVRQAAPILREYIKGQLEKYNLAADKLALLGFSQGTMMSLYVGPRYPQKIAGIVGYSGALVADMKTDSDILHKFPVYLAHGDADPVVPVEAYDHAYEGLAAAGFDVTGNVFSGLPHGINQQGLEGARTFLQRIFQQ